MDNQPKYEAQEKSEFFANDAAMREPVAGTVPRGEMRVNDSLYRGMDTRGNWLESNARTVTMHLLERGRERYDIYCSPCHSRIGDGKGIMVNRGYVPPPSFHTDRIRGLPDGEVFEVITHGVRNMPAYAHQIPVEDRWAIVAYMRALQRSQNATIEDVPVELRDKVK
jgi:mono/diheme cytochrome c family protein